MSVDQIHNFVAGYYTQCLKDHGPTPQGVDWNGRESQELRFEQLLKVVPTTGYDETSTLLDYGCGYAALLQFARAKGYTGSYLGFDLSTEMIARARQLGSTDSDAEFVSERASLKSVDFTVASGIFNVRGEVSDSDWLGYILETIADLDALSTHGFAFNMLTSYSDEDKKRDYLYYADPSLLFDVCKRKYSRHVALLHDYGLYEFTLLVRKVL